MIRRQNQKNYQRQNLRKLISENKNYYAVIGIFSNQNVAFVNKIQIYRRIQEFRQRKIK